MRCDRVQDLLSAYVDGELSRPLSAQIADHLMGCGACSTEHRSIGQVVSMLRALPEDEPPTALRGAILMALDHARPTLWQRVRAATLSLQPRSPYAFGAISTTLLGLLLSTVPVHRGAGTGRSLTRLAYQTPTEPILSRTHATAVTSSPKATLVPATQVGPATAIAPTTAVVETASDADAQPAAMPAPAPRRTTAAHRPVAHLERKAPVRTAEEGGSVPRRAPAAMPIFDPLAPVLEPVGSPSAPAMPNVVVADPPPMMPDIETTRVAASVPADEMPGANAAADDLAALRQRLAREQLVLPVPQIPTVPRHRKAQGIPLLRSEF